MNTEAIQDQVQTTAGKYLRQARENIGLSQQTVAKRLCLKISVIRDIEDDHINFNFSSMFLLGYIRSYARLVHVSEEKLMPMISKQVLIEDPNIRPIKSFSRIKKYNKCDNWLTWFTYLILLLVISMTGTWWWHNHQTQYQDIASIANLAIQSSTQLSQECNTTTDAFSDISVDVVSH